MRARGGSRVGVSVPQAKRYTKQACKDFVGHAQEKEDRDRVIYSARVAVQKKREATTAGAKGETCDALYERLSPFREKEVSAKTLRDDAVVWRKWCKRIRDKAARDVDADDIEAIRDELNAAIDAYEAAGCMSGQGRLAYKTAGKVWGVLRTFFKNVSTRKGPKDVRVREDLGDPTIGIEPPRSGPSKQRRWLRPYEVNALIGWLALNGEREWAEAIAVGYYLHVRPNELHELRAKDVDLVAHEVSVMRAYDEETGEVGPPKTAAGIRTIAIPATLYPLLQRLVRERKAGDLLCPVIAATPESLGERGVSRATVLRGFVERAGIERGAELFEQTRTHLALDFRGAIRDSGITARFLADHKAEDVQREAGHEELSTTLGYAKAVKNHRGR